MGRRSALLGMLFAVTLSGCRGGGPGGPNGDESSVTGFADVPQRFFGVFHYDAFAVGDKFVDDPDDEMTAIATFSSFEIDPAGTFRFSYHVCAHEPHVFEYSWTWDPAEQALVISPDGAPSAPEIDLYYRTVESITITAGAGCDDLVVTVVEGDHDPDGDMYRGVPGALCADGTGCTFTLAWCQAAPPACGP